MQRKPTAPAPAAAVSDRSRPPAVSVSIRPRISARSATRGSSRQTTIRWRRRCGCSGTTGARASTSTRSPARRRASTTCRPRCSACRPITSRSGTRGAGRQPPGIARCFPPASCVAEADREDQSVYHLFVVRVERRDAFRAHLAAHGVATAVHYPIPLHLQPAFRHFGHGPGDFPVAERLARDVVSLPMHPFLEESQHSVHRRRRGRLFLGPARPVAVRTDRIVINVGLIGYGYWGPNLARNLAETERPEALGDRRRASRSPRSRRAAASRRAVCGDAARLVARDALDAVVIATPLQTHYRAREGGDRARQARPRREAARRIAGARRGARRARRAARRAAHGRSHVRLYWRRAQDPRADRRRRARRAATISTRCA